MSNWLSDSALQHDGGAECDPGHADHGRPAAAGQLLHNTAVEEGMKFSCEAGLWQVLPGVAVGTILLLRRRGF